MPPKAGRRSPSPSRFPRPSGRCSTKTCGDHRRLYVTLGQFSIVRLERDVQLVVPMVEYAIPEKECCDSEGCCTEDPCEMFSRIPFPARQFTPTGCDRKKENNCDQD